MAAEATTCIFCLEETDIPKPARLHCSCRFQTHPDCWKRYEEQKRQCECPLCHTVFLNNPLVHVIVVAPIQVEIQPDPEEEERLRRYPRLQRISQGCLGCLLLLILIVIIWEWAAYI